MTQFKTHISRRSFFKSTVIVGGGMLLGFNWLSSCMREEDAARALVLPDEWFDINAFLKIGNNGVVTIMAPNPEIGQNVKTSLPMIVAEELDVDWNQVIVEQAPLNTDAFTRQVAGGSQSVRQSWEGLRKAGATARHMLVAAAAARWGVDPADCSTSKGVITGEDGRQLRYEEVATEAAGMEVPEEVELKDPSEFKIVGTGHGNVDIEKIITGQPLYGIDTQKEGMQFAVVLRPPAFGQKLVSFDDSEARKVNGVTDVIRFGDKIAVLAKSTWPAIKGKKALRAQWAVDTPLESTAQHDKAMVDLLDKRSEEPMRKDGDVKKAFAEADQVLERVYEAPYLPHNPMEPMNFYADVREDGVELTGPTQTPAGARREVAELLGRNESEITLMMTRQGGGFGRRLYNDPAQEAAEISSLAKSPVQLVFTREDDMTAGTYRPATKYKVRASIKDGQITGYHLTEAAMSSHLYGSIAHFFPAGIIPNFLFEAHAVESNITTGAWRAPHTNFHAFVDQSFFDELAEALKADPVLLRLDLLEKVKELQDDRIQYSPERLQGVIRLVAEKGNWGKAPEGVYQGFSAYYCHNTHVAELAEVVLNDGKPVLKKIYCAIDCGIVVNPLAARNQAEGGIIDGIGHAMYGDLTFSDGQPSYNNFDTYRLIRMSEAPEVEVHFVENDIAPTGLGEPPFPPAAPAFANAVYKATGKRLYKFPFVKELEG
ncbi:MAG: xanthine dehydrogenase family protein molybdopterin-binding subunit [Lewinellaceae bacterium]|nr:xanthine dehydrogenase family protein molybdopterin-binding subunit [Lewinellaceae bacterium]